MSAPRGYDDKLAYGKRLRQLSQLVDRDATRLYALLGVEFEQRWFGVLNELTRHGQLSVRDLAKNLEITHASVSETRKSLEKKGYISASPDPKDGRRRLLALTDKGLAFMTDMEPAFKALESVAQELDQEFETLMTMLNDLHHALKQKSIFERAKEIMT